MDIKDRLRKWLAPEVKSEKKELGVLGSFFGNNTLSNEKTISTKLLLANKDWVYKNNDVIATEVATIEFCLYSVKIVGGKFEYTKIDNHPLLDRLDKFNESTTKTDGIYITQSHKKLTGDAFWLDKGDEFYILQPDGVEVLLGDPNRKDGKLITGYKYKQTIDGKQVDVTYKPEEVIHFKKPNPNNPIRGYGAVEAAADVIDLDQLTTDLSKKFFQNGAITNFILTTEGKIQDEQLKRLKAEFKSAYGGSRNAYKTMILGGGLKPETVQQTNREMEFLSQLEWYRDKIMVIFGNTKASLGIIDDVNRASHESSMVSWKRNSVKPEMENLVNTLNEFLVPQYGDNLLLGFEDPIPEDRKAKLEEVKVATEAGILSKNEARELLGYETLGSEYDEVPTFEVPAPLENIDLGKTLRQRGMFANRAEYQNYQKIGRSIAKSLKKPKKEQAERIHHSLTNEQVENYVDKQLGAVEQVEKRLENRVQQFIMEVSEEALLNYPEQQPKQYNKALIDEDKFLVKAQLDFTPLLKDIAILAGNEALDLIDEKLVYYGFDYEQTIIRNVRKFTQSMLQTEQDKMVEIIKQGIADGLSIPNIRSNMQAEFVNLSKIQAERISRTEVIRTSNEASIDAWRESGVVEGKQWLTTEDGREDSECAELNGEIVWNLGGDFYQKEGEFENGDPPLHPNCRCVVLPVLEKSKAFDDKALQKIKELEADIDKRTKEFRDLKAKNLDMEDYIKELERINGL